MIETLPPPSLCPVCAKLLSEDEKRFLWCVDCGEFPRRASSPTKFFIGGTVFEPGIYVLRRLCDVADEQEAPENSNKADPRAITARGCDSDLDRAGSRDLRVALAMCDANPTKAGKMAADIRLALEWDRQGRATGGLLACVFAWSHTVEGKDYWTRQAAARSLSEEARQRLAAYAEALDFIAK